MSKFLGYNVFGSHYCEDHAQVIEPYATPVRSGTWEGDRFECVDCAAIRRNPEYGMTTKEKIEAVLERVEFYRYHQLAQPFTDDQIQVLKSVLDEYFERPKYTFGKVQV